MIITHPNSSIRILFRVVEITDDESEEIVRHHGCGPVCGLDPPIKSLDLGFLDAVGEGDHAGAVLDLGMEDGF